MHSAGGRPAFPLPDRFRFIRVLGSGSSGTVCLVHDSVRRRDVALKWSDGALEDPGAEFLAMARLTPHPALSRPLDCSHDAGASWFTMEPAFGTPLRALLTRPESLRLLPAVAAKIAEGLEALHRQGFVHRDLKPENVIVAESGDHVDLVTLIDLGLARSHGTGPAEHAVAAGTLPYIAPEMFLGHPPDPRSDLYALGVLLYEWRCGRRPFEAGTPAELVRRVLYGPAPAPPPALDGFAAFPVLVSRLLARSIDDRPGSAAEVLESLAGSPVSDETARPAGRTERLYREPAFTGRDEELWQFEMAFERAATRAVIVRLSGDPGSGRRRLLRELRFRKFAGTAGWVELDAHRLPALDCLAEGARQLGLIAGSGPSASDTGDAAAGAELEIAAGRFRAALDGLSGRGVAVLVVHTPADPAFSAALDFITGESPGGLLVVEVTAGELPERGTGPEIRLAPLPADRIAELLSGLAGDLLEPGELKRIAELSGGVPGHAVEMLRSLRTGRPGDGGKVEVPDSLESTLADLAGNAGRSGPAAAATLDAAAILHPDIDPEVVAAILETPLAEARASLAALSGAGGPLTALESGAGTRYRFRLPLLATFLRERLDGEWRREGHRRAALHRPGDAATTRDALEERARHWLGAVPRVDRVEAALRGKAAGEAAARAFDWDRAFEWFDRGFSVLADNAASEEAALRADLLGLSAQAAAHSGRNEEASARFHRLAVEATDPAGAARALRRHAEILQATLGYSEAAGNALATALSILEPGVDDLERARLLETSADGARIRGLIDEAVRLGSESIDLLTAAGAPALDRAHALATLGYARLFSGDHEAARRDLEASLAIAREASDPAAEARALQYLSVIEGHLGRYAAVREYMVLVRERSGQAGDVRRAVAAEQSIGVADYYEGRLNEAVTVLTRGRRRALSIGDRQILCYFDLILGLAHRSAGRFDLSEEILTRARASAEFSGITLAKALAEAGLAWTALNRGDLEVALTLIEQSPVDAGNDPLSTAQRARVFGLIRLERGEFAEALELAGRALHESRRVRSPKFEPAALDLSARAELGLGRDPAELTGDVETGLAIARELNVGEYIVDLLVTRSEIESRSGARDEALSSAIEARDRARTLGLEPARVRALFRVGQALADLGGLYDDRALDALDEALDRAHHLGMKRDEERAAALLKQLDDAWEG